MESKDSGLTPDRPHGERTRADRPNTDVYSLGQVLWHMLPTNRRTSGGERIDIAEADIQNGWPTWERSTVPVIRKRIQTVTEFRMRLQNEGICPRVAHGGEAESRYQEQEAWASLCGKEVDEDFIACGNSVQSGLRSLRWHGWHGEGKTLGDGGQKFVKAIGSLAAKSPRSGQLR